MTAQVSTPAATCASGAALSLPDGLAVTGELRHVWEHDSNLSWQRVAVTLNKRFDAHWAGSLQAGRYSGDRKDRGAVTVKYFF